MDKQCFQSKNVRKIEKTPNVDLMDKTETERMITRQSKVPFNETFGEREKLNLYAIGKENICFH